MLPSSAANVSIVVGTLEHGPTRGALHRLHHLLIAANRLLAVSHIAPIWLIMPIFTWILNEIACSCVRIW